MGDTVTEPQQDDELEQAERFTRIQGEQLEFNFYDCLAKEKEQNPILDAHFSPHWRVEPVTLDEELAYGIDRIFISKSSAHRISVEYKHDFRAADTNNFFIEFEVDNKIGWLQKSVAQVLVLHIPGNKEIYWVNMLNFKSFIANTREEYRVGECKNEKYKAHGYLVPVLRVFNQSFCIKRDYE